MAQNEILTLRQAATRLQLADREVLELLSAGALKGQKAGTQWRLQAADVEAYLNSKAGGGTSAGGGTAEGAQGDKG